MWNFRKIHDAKIIINFDNITKENISENNLNWSQSPKHS